MNIEVFLKIINGLKWLKRGSLAIFLGTAMITASVVIVLLMAMSVGFIVLSYVMSSQGLSIGGSPYEYQPGIVESKVYELLSLIAITALIFSLLSLIGGIAVLVGVVLFIVGGWSLSKYLHRLRTPVALMVIGIAGGVGFAIVARLALPRIISSLSVASTYLLLLTIIGFAIGLLGLIGFLWFLKRFNDYFENPYIGRALTVFTAFIVFSILSIVFAPITAPLLIGAAAPSPDTLFFILGLAIVGVAVILGLPMFGYYSIYKGVKEIIKKGIANAEGGKESGVEAELEDELLDELLGELPPPPPKI